MGSTPNRALMALLWLMAVACDGGEPLAVVQPMHFNHAAHAGEDLTCLDCHVDADSGPYASVLGVESCFKCHKDVEEGEHADIQKIRDYHERGLEIPWVQVNRVKGHVYFSHEAHVKWAEMDCKACHGDMAKTEGPVVRSQTENLTMARCMGCHKDKGAKNDCEACHK